MGILSRTLDDFYISVLSMLMNFRKGYQRQTMAISRADAIALSQDVLNQHPEVSPIDLSRLRITDQVVTEAQDGNTPLSDAILDSCFKRANSAIEYAHYTSFPVFQSMIKVAEWRLYWVYKRILENEYKTFCDDHGLSGYLATNAATGRPFCEEICKDLFYSSLTQYPSKTEDNMWRVFADQGRGVRLILRVQPVQRRAEVRSVRYKNTLSQTIIQELMNAARTQIGRALVLMGISRIAAFYLPLGYVDEEETRLLIKRFNVAGLHYNPWAIVQNVGPNQYLPLTLNEDNEFCRIDLLRVDPGPDCSPRAVNNILRQNPKFAHLARRGCFGVLMPWLT